MLLSLEKPGGYVSALGGIPAPAAGVFSPCADILSMSQPIDTGLAACVVTHDAEIVCDSDNPRPLSASKIATNRHCQTGQNVCLHVPGLYFR